MAWFRKKQIPKEEKVIPTCDHKWKDFPWYMSGKYYYETRYATLQIIEPYVCIHCKERKDVVLHTITRANYSQDDVKAFLDTMNELYGEYCKPRPIVEDMINDMQLVDREYLKFAELIHTTRKGELPKLEI